MDDVPFVAFGNDELRQLPRLKKGDEIECQHCKGRHPVECGTENGVETDLLMFYKCGEHTYLAAVDGRNVTSAFPREGE